MEFTAFAGSAKIANDLLGASSADSVDVIIQYQQAPTALDHQKVLSYGGSLKQEWGFVKGATYSVPASALAELAADPDVAYISPDRPLSSTASFTPTLDYYTGTVNAPWANDIP